MTTITAKELRDNLSVTLKRVSNGEAIEIIYRSRPIATLNPVKQQKPNGAAIARAIKELEPAIKNHKTGLDPNKNFDELYEDLLRNDPKYKKYFDD